eukprot:6113362-Amphidinium_carterae.1
MGDGRTHSFWNLLEVQPANAPDRGIEKSLKRPRDGTGTASQSSPSTAAAAPALCFVCGLPRDAHPQRRFCSSKGGKSAKGKGKGKGRKPSTPPAPPSAPAASAIAPAVAAASATKQ